VILAHHGYGEELLPAFLASGGATTIAVIARAKLAWMARWLRRR
jgi:hypothetical protein